MRAPVWEATSEHDFKAAERYLTLRFTDLRAQLLRRKLELSPTTYVRVNDVLRAFNREPLSRTDPGVERVIEKIRAGEALRPPLLVSFDDGGDIADGYHRISAIYWTHGPFTEIPARLAHKE